jgi:hypothetical protein
MAKQIQMPNRFTINARASDKSVYLMSSKSTPSRITPIGSAMSPLC